MDGTLLRVHLLPEFECQRLLVSVIFSGYCNALYAAISPNQLDTRDRTTYGISTGGGGMETLVCYVFR